jgi:hypothetical protein
VAAQLSRAVIGGLVAGLAAFAAWILIPIGFRLVPFLVGNLSSLHLGYFQLSDVLAVDVTVSTWQALLVGGLACGAGAYLTWTRRQRGAR